MRVKLADFGLSRTVEKMGNDLSLFHARWTAPEIWDDYIDDEYIEGKISEEISFSLQVITLIGVILKHCLQHAFL